jgi:hypothetical protein
MFQNHRNIFLYPTLCFIFQSLTFTKEERESAKRRAKRKLIGDQSPAISNYNFRVYEELSGDSLFSKK